MTSFELNNIFPTNVSVVSTVRVVVSVEMSCTL